MKQQPVREGLIAVRQLDRAETAPEPVFTPPLPQFAADQVGPGRQVSLHFALELESGEVIDSCYERAPVAFMVGDGSLLPDFEQSLFGLRAGDNLDLVLPAERAFGLPNAANVQRFARFRFAPDLPLTEGLVLDFADSNGNSQAGVVRSCDSQWVRIDFNHPLAGKAIRFRATIVHVQASD